MFSFNEQLVAYLARCDYATMIGFYHALGPKAHEYPNSSFRRTLREAGHDYSTDNSWQRYMGGLTAQGREFYERVMDVPEAALTRLPASEAYQDQELVIFSPYDAVARKARGEWDLSDMLADSLPPQPPLPHDPVWRTRLIRNLATVADANPLADGLLEPARLAILADALEEAGCENADLVGHLRDPDPHLHGCWAIDALLQQS